MNTKINLRIDEYTKEALDEYASQEGKQLSEYIRDILRNHVGLIPNHIEDEYFVIPQLEVIDALNEYENSYDFTYLLTWLFCRYMFPIETNSEEAIQSIKRRVELAINESGFSQELKLEFMKVLNDINRFLVESEYERKQFYFPLKNHQLSFNYNLLMNEIWSKKY
ncbi:DUF6364 family protein [Winogradskyella thalassocola]|uniref:Ribbon-helix-helix protein, copG family n=1 Tax=Winogradskyella thalassocola TaxID=262004 RepID=A0A1G7ZLW6_9FLAO|nr:DUF6364 family protein [Winogradskyella thalassocola]SDH09556.1 hypothetical protein SAMN04489796_1011372 [Winogradskyella thalassocola]